VNVDLIGQNPPALLGVGYGTPPQGDALQQASVDSPAFDAARADLSAANDLFGTDSSDSTGSSDLVPPPELTPAQQELLSAGSPTLAMAAANPAYASSVAQLASLQTTLPALLPALPSGSLFDTLA
jgi:hypothetical protein